MIDQLGILGTREIPILPHSFGECVEVRRDRDRSPLLFPKFPLGVSVHLYSPVALRHSLRCVTPV